MKLHAWLDENRKTLTWLARETGLSIAYISRLIERNGFTEKSPSMETCAKISEATDGAVTANDFMPASVDRKKKRARDARAAA